MKTFGGKILVCYWGGVYIRKVSGKLNAPVIRQKQRALGHLAHLPLQLQTSFLGK